MKIIIEKIVKEELDLVVPFYSNNISKCLVEKSKKIVCPGNCTACLFYRPNYEKVMTKKEK